MKQCNTDNIPALIKILHAPQVVPKSSGYRAYQVAESDGSLILYNMNSTTPREEVEELAKLYGMIGTPGMSEARHPVLFIRHNIPYPSRDISADCTAADPNIVPYADQEDRALARGLGITIIEASALTGYNVEEAFHSLIRRLRSNARR